VQYLRHVRAARRNRDAVRALNTAALLSAYAFIAGGRKPFVYLSYAALGAAVLTKGPVALLFVLLPVLLLLRSNPRARAYLCCGVGWLLLLVIGLSWYAWVTSQLGLARGAQSSRPI